MTIQEAIAKSTALTTGTSITGADMVRWLSEYDGKLAREFFKKTDWTAYNAANDQNKALIVLQPWDGLYVHLLEKMVYYTTGEYQRSENARAMEARMLAEFKAWVMRTYCRPCPAVLDRILNTGG